MLSTLVESSRVFLAEAIVDSDWPTKFIVFCATMAAGIFWATAMDQGWVWFGHSRVNLLR